MKRATNKLCIIVGTLLLLSGCSLLPKEDEPLEPPLVEPSATQYETEEVESEELVDAFEARGSFESDDEADLTSPDEGQEVEEIHVESNDKVEEGDTLVEMEVEDLPLDIKQQELSVKDAELSLETAKESVEDHNKQGDKMKKLKNERDEAENKLSELKDEQEDNPDEDISADIEEQEAKAENKKSEVDAKEEEIDSESEAELQQEIDSAELDLERERNELDDLEEKLDAATVTAPISGVVTSLEDIKEGETLEPETTIATVSDPDSLRLETDDDQNKWDDISNEMDVDVTIGDHDLTGEVADVPGSDDDDGKLTVDVEDIPDSVDLGERADMEIIFEKRDDVLTIPEEAIRNYDEQEVVRVLDEDDLSEVNIETGLEVDDKVEVESGLEEGDEVILR